MAVRVIAAMFLGALLGIEREVHGRPTGLRTLSLVAAGAAVFTVLGLLKAGPDANRIAAQVVTGVGFLGAGVILHREDRVRGMTTAATVWIAAAIGMSAGYGHLGLAVVVTVLALIALAVLRPLESMWLRREDPPAAAPGDQSE